VGGFVDLLPVLVLEYRLDVFVFSPSG